jgi:hypothetical protein
MPILYKSTLLYKSTIANHCRHRVDIVLASCRHVCRIRVDICVVFVSAYIETLYRNSLYKLCIETRDIAAGGSLSFFTDTRRLQG